MLPRMLACLRLVERRAGRPASRTVKIESTQKKQAFSFPLAGKLERIVVVSQREILARFD